MWPPHAWPHSVRTGYPHTPTQGNTTTLKRRQGAQHGLYGRIYILSSLWQDSHFRMFLPFAFTYLLAVAQMMYHAIVGARRNVTRLGPWLCLCLLLQGSSSSFRGVMVFRASSSQWLRLRRQRGGVARPPRRRLPPRDARSRHSEGRMWTSCSTRRSTSDRRGAGGWAVCRAP